MSEECDVLICGSSSAGLCAAVWLARAGINFRILERREGMLKQGQADGVQVRTVEIMEHLGLSEDVLKEAYHVLELAFWSADGNGGIRRSHLEPDTEPGLSHLPHVILNQARINEFLIQDIIKSSGESPIRYSNDVYQVVVDGEAAQDPNAHCVTVKSMENGVERTYRAKYALSDAGNLVIIPREGDEKVRFYLEMPVTTPAEVTPEKVKERLDRIFKPYQVELAETSWFSAYSIGQRLADHFTQDHRVFLTGDACHTHSPKAGQGMNVSLQDGYNIGWKLAAVLRGQAYPSILETYVSERHQTAKDLIDFDRQFARMFSSSYRKEHGYSTQDFQEYFIKSGRYTAGLATQYKLSMLVKPGEHDDLARGLSAGMRFPSAQVVRFSDAKAMQLSKTLQADSRWSLVIFPGDIAQHHAEQRLIKLASNLEVLLRRFTDTQRETNGFLNPILVSKSDRKRLDDKKIPKLFMPYTGKWGVKCDIPSSPCHQVAQVQTAYFYLEIGLQNIFVDDESYHAGHGQAYAKYGVDPEAGAMVLIRPDQYISGIYALESTDAITTFFESFLVRTTNGLH
ncbi:putative FAD binding domain-containing protein [Colletotrichum sublineola]|uniref:Putative FAD binding domain-containing protein n=1 Tax=Colletotrichum sublineola TaxID=1173701 RepID=A0A066XRF8_COLSU|nr:putative FAD binding domain-containing protein [Colletotrichum sublineola]